MRKVLPMRNRAMLFLACALLTIALGQTQGQKKNASQRNTPQVVHVEGDVEYTHDPSIAKDGDTWYLFGTANGPGPQGRTSHSLLSGFTSVETLRLRVRTDSRVDQKAKSRDERIVGS